MIDGADGGPWRWVTSAGTMRAIAAVDPEIAEAAFGSGRAIALGGWPGAITGRSWASGEEFERDAASGAVADEVRVLMYDPERWRHTPPAERRDPIAAIVRFGELAHRLGRVAMVTPHPGLLSVAGSALARGEGEAEDEAYLRCGLTEAAARAADVVETQAQRLENDPRAYRAFVARTAGLARGANPNVRVLSGLSTSPGFPATSRMLVDAWASVAGVVDGHYLSLAKGRYPEVMAAFLRVALAQG